MSENYTASLELVSKGKNKSFLHLKEDSVVGILDNGIFGKAKTTIALQAVDSVFNGWIRYAILLLLGVLGVLAAIGMMVSGDSEASTWGMVLMVISLVLLAAFWFVRPAKVNIYSGTQVIGGTPKSIKEAEAFCEALVTAVGEASGSGRSSGSIAS